ncbi:hypothetical protein Hdeb2414_s0020g00555971 [Helianthus debilis subsp. tardiflorus]
MNSQLGQSKGLHQHTPLFIFFIWQQRKTGTHMKSAAPPRHRLCPVVTAVDHFLGLRVRPVVMALSGGLQSAESDG